MDNVTKEAEIEAKVELKVQAMASENATDSLTMDVAKEAGTDVSSPGEEGGVGSGETLSVQVDPLVDLSKLDTKINDSVNTSLNDFSEFFNAKEVEESLLESGALAQGAETTSNPDGMTDDLENLTVIQDSRNEVEKQRIAPNSIAEV